MVGDFIEIPVGGRYGYGYFSHEEKVIGYGTLLRVMPGLHDRPIEDDGTISALLRGAEQFAVFLPLRPLCRGGELRIVRNWLPPPAHFMKFPTFRGAHLKIPESIIIGWTLWDGATERIVEDLSEEERDFPILEGAGLPVVQKRLRSGWTPRRQVTGGRPVTI